MRVLSLSSLLLAGSLLFIAGPAAAGVDAGTGEVQLYLGWNWPDTANDDADDVTFGVRGGYNFTKHFGVELGIGFFDTEAPLPDPLNNVDTTAWFTDLSLVWMANPDGKAVFLAYAGPGWTGWDMDINLPDVDDEESSFSAHVGLGTKIYAGENVFIRLDGKVRFFDIDITYLDDSVTDYEASAAIGWTFGR